jgi:ABC-type transport system involved in multi-copper enzyme maturation permease subunit
MSAITATHADSARATRQPGFTDLMRSEWTKFTTLRSTWWSLVVMIVVSFGVSIAVISVDTSQYKTLDPAIRAQFRDNTIAQLLQPGAAFGELAITVLGVLLIASEYSTGMIRSSILAAPRRTPVLAAKAAILCTAVFVLSEAIAWAIFFVGSAVANKHVTLTLGTPGSLRAIFGYGLVMAFTALTGLAFGALLRSPAAAISVALGTNLVLPVLTGFIPGSAGLHATLATQSRASQMIMARTVDPGTPYGPWGGLAISAAWALGMLALALVSIKRRDV